MLLEKHKKGLLGGGVGADAGADGDGGVVVEDWRQGEEFVAGVETHHGLGESGLHGVDTALWEVDTHQSAAAAQRSFGRQNGTTHAPIGTGNQ